MSLCGMGSSKGFRNWIAYHHQNCLCGELPNRMRCPSHENSLVDSCRTSRCACVWFVYTHIFRQTFSMLVQQHSRGNHQPYYTSLEYNRNYIVALIVGMSSVASSGRIGVWENVSTLLKQDLEFLHGKLLFMLSLLNSSLILFGIGSLGCLKHH